MGVELIDIYHALKQGTPVVVATIISSRGSTPRNAGSKMVVYGDGRTSGTIGGGAIEGDVIKRALAVFDAKRGNIASYDLCADAAHDDIDLICGGHMEVMLEYVDTHLENGVLYNAACQNIENEHPFSWRAVIKEMDSGIVLERCIQDITEPHDGKRLKTLVFDDRSAFASESRFPEADGIHVCPDYVNIFEPFKITHNSYIIIVTRGHSCDKEVLNQALKTGAGYIGMMGSRKKRNTIYDALITEGCKVKELDRVHCPIGLPIRAETPAELAVSIAAELINHRASYTAHG